MSLYETDIYIAQRSYPLDEVQTDMLIYLYQPLIGSQGFSLYMFLYNEAKRMDRFHKACAVSRITKCLNIDTSQLENLLKALEAIGLVKTYYKKKKEQISYVYDLQSPLSLRSFFRNHILTTLLAQTIGREELEKTKVYFRIASENLKDYEAMNIKFQDVYAVDLSQARPLRLRDHYMDMHTGAIDIAYDMTLCLEALKDNRIPMRYFKEEIEDIKQIAVLYHIDPLTLSTLIRESIDRDHVNLEKLRTKAKEYYGMDTITQLSEVYHTQPERYKSQLSGQSALDQHLAYLERITPYELLKNKQGGKEPIIRDLTIAETLMVQLGLTPAVTNVLLEYVMGKNEGRLPRAYTETIGASWARRSLKTARDAYEAAIAIDQPIQSTQVSEPEDEESPSSDDLLRLLNKVKGE